MDPVKPRLATACEDNLLRLLELEGQSVPDTVSGHRGHVNHLAFSPDGELLASAGGDHAVLVFGARSRRLVATFEGHGDQVDHVAFLPDGSGLLSVGRDRRLLVWRLDRERRPADAIARLARCRLPLALVDGRVVPVSQPPAGCP